jgi:hypothetical protein
MNEKHKRILTLALLMIVAAPMFFYVGFLVKQKMIRNNMLERLESSALQTISINNKDVKWEEVNKEIIINGELFDVESFVIKTDRIIVTGLFDIDEDKLKDYYVNSLCPKKDNSAPLEELLFKFIFTSVLLNDASTAIQLNGFVKLLFYHSNDVVYNNTIDVVSPPPNVWFYC